MKTKIYKIAVLLIIGSLINISLGCSKKDQPVPDSDNERINSVEKIMASSSKNKSPEMRVALNSSAMLDVGGTFKFTVTLTKAGKILANTWIGIEDPIAGFCAQERTNSKGVLNYNSKIAKFNTPGTYLFNFVIDGATPVTVITAVKSRENGRTFSRTSIALGIMTKSPIPPAVNLISRKAEPIAFSASSATYRYLSTDFGRDLYEDLEKNKINNAVLQVAQVFCPLSFNPYAGATCLASVGFIAGQITTSGAKLLFNNMVDNSRLTSSDKTKWKKFVEIGAIGYSIYTLKPDGAPALIKTLEISSIILDARSIIPNPLPNSSKAKGYWISGIIKKGAHRGEACVIAVYKK